MTTSSLWRPYTSMASPPDLLCVADTDGAYLILEDKTKLLDAVGSWWTCIHGYRPAPIIEAMQAQLKTVPHVMLGGCHHPITAQLSDTLISLAPKGMSVAFLSDSGSISVEVAMKIAIQHFFNQGQTKRQQFISFDHSYHGDTFGAMSLCDPKEGMHRLFAHTCAQQYTHALPDTQARLASLTQLLEQEHENIAGIFIEPRIQGAGGMKVHSPAVLQHLRQLCDTYGVLLIADEIFTGLGRCGTWWACDTAQVVPDILCIGKGLTGGVITLAATLCTEKVFAPFNSTDPEKALMHGPTFMGNPLACCAALANLEMMQSYPWQSNVATIEKTLLDQLSPAQSHPTVKEVRVLGAMGAIQLKQAPPSWHQTQEYAKKEGVWLRPFGDIIYTTPPYTISQKECEHITQVMIGALAYL